MRDKAIERSPSECHLGLIQTAYGVALILGLEQVAESLYGVLDTLFSRFFFIKLAVAVVLILLGLRLFAAVSNLRRYLASDLASDRRRQRLSAIAHVPILLCHAFLFFLLCRLDRDGATTERLFANLPLMLSLYCLLLALNAGWLLAMFAKIETILSENSRTWAGLNVLTILLVLLVMIARALFGLSDAICFWILVSVLVTMSFADLWTTAEEYFSVPADGQPPPPDELASSAPAV